METELSLNPSFLTYKSFLIFKNKWWVPLVAQWLRILLLMQGTWVRSLVGKDPTCHGATKPVGHKY